MSASQTLTAPARATTASGRAPRRRPNRRRRAPVLYLLPAVLVLAAFALYPLIVLIRMALSNVGPTNIVGDWPFTGGAELATALSDAEFWASLGRTAQLCVVLLVVNLVIGFIIASVLRNTGRTTTIVLGIMVFVWALPPLVSASVWKFLLDSDGAINAILTGVGLPAVDWLSDPNVAMWAVAGVVAWAGLPFSALILRGGLMAISHDIIEAAALDGATYWRTQFQVVLPLMRPTLWILSILTILYAFKSFDFIYVLTSGGPGTATSTIPVLSYYTAFQSFSMSTGAAIAVLAMIIVAVLAIPYVRSVRKEQPE